jgi:uncharacterized protein
MLTKKTLLLGASDNPARYSFIALKKLIAYGHPVVAIGRNKTMVNNVEISTGTPEQEQINTITLYLNPSNQKSYYDYILSLRPNRIIFNPGTENPELVALANEQGIATIEACTLVMLSTGQY